MAAVMRAAAGQSFVLEGPPGTGKSQTITNLIAHALVEGKTVLFVAEKQAALEVVQRRLDAIGIGALALELHGSKQSMTSIREQLRQRAGAGRAGRPGRLGCGGWRDAGRDLPTGVAHRPAFTRRNPAGHSLWSAYDAVPRPDADRWRRSPHRPA